MQASDKWKIIALHHRLFSIILQSLPSSSRIKFDKDYEIRVSHGSMIGETDLLIVYLYYHPIGIGIKDQASTILWGMSIKSYSPSINHPSQLKLCLRWRIIPKQTEAKVLFYILLQIPWDTTECWKSSADLAYLTIYIIVSQSCMARENQQTIQGELCDSIGSSPPTPDMST